MPNLHPELIALGFIWFVVFLFSTTCHEAAHALAAKLGGDPTAFHGGQVTLNPIPHLRRAAWMSLAGPAANFPLMLLAGAAIRIGIAAGLFRAPAAASFTNITEPVLAGGSSFASTFLSILFVLNLLLGTFNLIPVPPLDGSTGITVFMSEGRALRYLDWLREFNFGFLGLAIAWVAFDKIFDIAFRLALNLLYPGMHYGH